MKNKEKEEARKLRQEKGWPITKIAKTLGVAKSSVSLWVRDVELSEEQKIQLMERHPCNNNKNYSKNCWEKRKNYQKQGKKLAMSNKNDSLFVSGCMLYWAEGAKDKNVVRMSNSDVNMMKLFVDFLMLIGTKIEVISIYINCYTDINDLKDIKDFWITSLGLDLTCLRKSTVNYFSKYSQFKRKGKLPYGTCKLVVCSTEVVQKIFGAIQEIAGFDNESWLGSYL